MCLYGFYIRATLYGASYSSCCSSEFTLNWRQLLVRGIVLIFSCFIHLFSPRVEIQRQRIKKENRNFLSTKTYTRSNGRYKNISIVAETLSSMTKRHNTLYIRSMNSQLWHISKKIFLMQHILGCIRKIRLASRQPSYIFHVKNLSTQHFNICKHM